MNVRETVSTILAACPLAVLPAPAPAAETIATQPRVIEVIADKDNTFKVAGERKPVIRLEAAERVVLRITARFGGEKARDNSVHSLVVKKLRDQGWDIRLKEGTQDFSLVAPENPGEYDVECTVKCGPGHDDMKMKLIVQS